MSRRKTSIWLCLISFPVYDFKAIENRQANLQDHRGIRLDRREPLLNLLYQSTKLVKELKAQQARDAENAARQKHAAQRAINANAAAARRRR